MYKVHFNKVAKNKLVKRGGGKRYKFHILEHKQLGATDQEPLSGPVLWHNRLSQHPVWYQLKSNYSNSDPPP